MRPDFRHLKISLSQRQTMNRKLATFAGSILLCMTQLANGAGSLCSKSETTYFSCPTKAGKVISLCGKVFERDKRGDRVDVEDQWLQYRFGTPGAIELSYPRAKASSVGSFKAERIRAQGGEIHLDSVLFISGGIGYSVESATPDGGGLMEGVSVGDPKDFGMESAGKRREHYPKAQIQCAGAADTKNFFDLVEYLDAAPR